MSKIVNLKQFRKSKEDLRAKDPWCSKLVRDDGSSISGGAAREARLKAAGGVDAVLRETFERASALARRSS